MVDDLLEGVLSALRGAFGAEYGYYREPAGPEAGKPCFVVTPLEPSVQPRLGARFRLDVPVDVQCFPAQAGSYVELTRVADKLPWVLDQVELPGGGVRGRETRWRIEAGTLRFLVTYTVFLERRAEETPMGEIRVESGI